MNKMKTYPALLAPALLTAVGAQAKQVKNNRADDTRRPNVIIIYADDLGYGDLQCYGAKNVETPNVNRLASQGIRFTNAHAVAATSTPSRYSLLTGEYAWRRADTEVSPANAGLPIRPEQFTLGEMVKRVRTATCTIPNWHCGLVDKGSEPD